MTRTPKEALQDIDRKIELLEGRISDLKDAKKTIMKYFNVDENGHTKVQKPTGKQSNGISQKGKPLQAHTS